MVSFIFFIITSSGVNSLLLPASPAGVTTGFSISKDAEAIFYNPAHFESGEDYKIWCSYNRFYLDMQSVSLALSKKIKSIHMGVAFLNFDYGDIELRPDYPTEDSVASYSANDFSIILGGSVNVTPQGKIGLNLKYISENIYLYSDHTIAFDFSLSYGSSKAEICLGASNFSFGSRITLRNEEVNLPARLSIGGMYQLGRFTTSVDAHYLVNTAIFEYGFGAGILLHEIFTTTAAINYRESFYPGFGIEVKVAKIKIKYGGAIFPKDLGMINTLGIGFDF